MESSKEGHVAHGNPLFCLISFPFWFYFLLWLLEFPLELPFLSLNYKVTSVVFCHHHMFHVGPSKHFLPQSNPSSKREFYTIAMKTKKQNNKQNNIIADMIKFWNQQETANELTFNLWPSSFREIKLRFFFISYNSMNLLCKIKIDLLIHVFIQFHYKYLSNMANLNICYISDIEQWGSWVKKRYRLNHEKSICPFFCGGKKYTTRDLPS